MAENLKRLPDEKLAKMSPEEQYVQGYLRDTPKIWYNPRTDGSFLFKGTSMNMDMMNYVWGTLFRDIDITRGLENFDRPVFLSLGRYDFLVGPPSLWDPIKPKFKNLTIKIFEKSGHISSCEEPAQYDAALVRWLDENKN